MDLTTAIAAVTLGFVVLRQVQTFGTKSEAKQAREDTQAELVEIKAFSRSTNEHVQKINGRLTTLEEWKRNQEKWIEAPPKLRRRK